MYQNKSKKKLLIETYRKHFDSFTEAILALKETHPVINEIFNGIDPTIEDASKAILKDFNNNFPNLTKGENIHTSLTLSSNRCSYKTDKMIAFGWSIKYTYNKKEDIVYIDDVEMKVTLFGKHEQNIYDVLSNNNWDKDEDNKHIKKN